MYCHPGENSWNKIRITLLQLLKPKTIIVMKSLRILLALYVCGISLTVKSQAAFDSVQFFFGGEAPGYNDHYRHGSDAVPQNERQYTACNLFLHFAR